MTPKHLTDLVKKWRELAEALRLDALEAEAAKDWQADDLEEASSQISQCADELEQALKEGED